MARSSTDAYSGLARRGLRRAIVSLLSLGVFLSSAGRLEASYVCLVAPLGAGFQVTFTDALAGITSNTLVLDLDPSGYLRHNRDGTVLPNDEMFDSPIDLFPGLAGTQPIHVSEILLVTVNAGVGNDVVTILEGFGINNTNPLNLVVNGGDGDDVLTVRAVLPSVVINGDADNDIITGSSGDDTINGGSGNDRLYPGAGANTVTDGLGNDFVDFSENSVRLNPPFNTGGGNDTVIGTRFNDTINGSAGDDYFAGGGGDDFLSAAGGDDQLFGGDGNDILIGGPGFDRMFGGADSDSMSPGDGFGYVVGGAGNDALQFIGAAGAEVFTMSGEGLGMRFLRDVGPVEIEAYEVESVRLETLGGADSVIVTDLFQTTDVRRISIDFGPADAAIDTVFVVGRAVGESIVVTTPTVAEDVNVTGLPYELTISRGQVAEGDALIIDAADGDDTITATAAAPALNLVLRGGNGNDRLAVASSGNLNGGPGDDILTGGTGADTLNGLAGNDTLIGNAGNDVLDGGLGDDVLDGGASAGGNNTIGGGPGFDTILGTGNELANTIVVAEAAGVVTFNVDATTGTNVITSVERIGLSGLGGNDTILVTNLSFEALVEGGDGNDTLIATGAMVVTLIGGSGDDGLGGGSAADRLEGGEGNDVLAGGGGNDRLLGGDGNDTITGGPGVDQIFGENDSDRIIWNPGDGSEAVEGGGGTDTLEFNGSAAVESFELGSSIFDGRAFVFRDVGNIFVASSEVESINLNPLGGADVILVGDLIVTAVRQILLNLQAADGAVDSVIVDGTDSPESIAVSTILPTVVLVRGLPYDLDLLIPPVPEGDALVIQGGGGDDVLLSRFNVEARIAITLSGGLGNDQLTAEGAATMFGGPGSDLLIGGTGADTLSGDEDNDTLIGNAGNDTFNGGSGNDRLVWNNGDGSDLMDGGDGTDVVEVNGSPTAADAFTVAPGGVPPRVAFARTAPGPFALDIGTTEVLAVNGLGGDDTFTASGALATLINLAVDGGPGNDTLTAADGTDDLRGGPGDDTLNGGGGIDTMRGGDGNDVLTGGTGNDFMFGDAWSDRLIWNNGDGTDLMDGGPDTDTVEVNGSPAAGDQFVVAQNLGQVRFDRINLGLFGLDIVTTERLVVNGLGGDDNVAINSGVAMALITVNGGDGNDTVGVAAGINGGALVLNGDAGDDTFSIVAQATTDITLAGGAHATGDTLAFNADCRLVASAPGSLTATDRRPVFHATIETVTTSQTFDVTPTSFALTGAGGTRDVAVSTGASCAWTAQPNATWLTIEGTAGGLGSGTVKFKADATNGPGRVGTLVVAGRTVTVTEGDITSALVRRYLPEGATSTFYDTRIALLNPNPDPSIVNVRFQKSDGVEAVVPLTMPPMSRMTVDPKTVLETAFAEFSTVVESFPSVVSDRTMTFGPDRYGSHAETSLPQPELTALVAEGSTLPGFTLFLLFQNPNPVAATVQVSYLRPAPAAVITRNYLLPAGQRVTVLVNSVDPALVNTNVSVSALSTNGVTFLMERSMYLDRPGEMFSAGLDSRGVPAGSLNWFFGEGATGAFFDTFMLISNPGAVAADVTGTYLRDDGVNVVKNYVVPANSRTNIWVDFEDPLLANAAFSSRFAVTNGVPVVMERSMWWPGPSSADWREAHTSAGATTTATRWAVADGETGGTSNVQTYLLIANTSAFAGVARVTLIFEDGSTASKILPLLASSRTNVNVATAFPASAGKRFGAIVESLGAPAAQLVLERSMYFDVKGVVWAAGSNLLGTPIP